MERAIGVSAAPNYGYDTAISTPRPPTMNAAIVTASHTDERRTLSMTTAILTPPAAAGPVPCRRCGRLLTDPWAAAVGIGAQCCRRLADDDRDRIAAAMRGLQLTLDLDLERSAA